ncbi:MAG: Na+/H+ antiporter NhaA [Muribaculaceae bacterium]|nr:Na+/H+ antiporter NhaA [Muribaculaceae bacterium]
MANAFFIARKTIKNHTNGGTVLMVATALALLVVNLPFLHDFYNSLWTHTIALRVGSFNLFSHHGHPMSIMDFINDGLMAVFFFSVGLEIKREVLEGELSSFRQALLPIVAAVGGMIVPVAIFFLLGHGTDYSAGAAIPMATDIAFSLGVLAMLGKRVPIGLKIFLTTLAVVDDIGGILVIAIFYSGHIDYVSLLWAAGLLAVLIAGGIYGVHYKTFYVTIGIFVWFLFLQSGVHPTIAGVLVAFCVPAKPVYAPKKYIKTIRNSISHFSKEDEEKLDSRGILTKEQTNWLKEIESASDKVISPLQDLEDSLHPIVNFIVVPLFAFANAGIWLGDVNVTDIFSGVSIAIIAGLVLGKFIGIFAFSWVCIKAKLAPMPEGSTWAQIAAVSVLGGIGFTVSLFIANLTFGEDVYLSQILNNAKLGILIGSFLAGFLGWFFLNLTLPKSLKNQESESID